MTFSPHPIQVGETESGNLWFPRDFLQILLKYLTIEKSRQRNRFRVLFLLGSGNEKVSEKRMHNSKESFPYGVAQKGLCDLSFQHIYPTFISFPDLKLHCCFIAFKNGSTWFSSLWAEGDVERKDPRIWSLEIRILLLLLLSLEIWIWTIVKDAQWPWATLWLTLAPAFLFTKWGYSLVWFCPVRCICSAAQMPFISICLLFH